MTAPLRALHKRDNQFRWDNSVHGETVAMIKDALSKHQYSVTVTSASRWRSNVTVHSQVSVPRSSRKVTPTSLPSEHSHRSNTPGVNWRMRSVLRSLLRLVGETNHRPLVAIGQKSLATSPKSLQRMLPNIQFIWHWPSLSARDQSRRSRHSESIGAGTILIVAFTL